MLLSRSTRRKIVATLVASVGISLLYQATVIDSRSVPAAVYGEALPDTTGRLPFIATAYCKGHTTASGVPVRSGIAAADPSVLPVGSIIRLDGAPEGHGGIYTVLDTGPKVQGRHVDLYMWSCHEALAFGRRKVSLTVIRRGWYPNPAPAGLPPSAD
jgi:3D (Asp-Asp-Asp) domain-containing protein